MRVYLLHDTDPQGGYFAAQQIKPDPVGERRTIDEVRVTDIPDSLWKDMLAGILPVDEDHSNDSTWIEWWDDAEVVWLR